MKDAPFYTDEEYLSGIKKSVYAVEKAFYNENYTMVRGLARKMDSGGLVNVDDLYQEVMVIVFTKIKNNELAVLTAKLSTYVYRTAHNLLLYRFRKHGRMPTLTLEGQDIADDAPSEIDLEALELTALEMVKRLVYPCSEILADWYIKKLDYEEIARKYRYKNANTAKKKKGECIGSARLEAKSLLVKFSL